MATTGLNSRRTRLDGEPAGGFVSQMGHALRTTIVVGAAFFLITRVSYADPVSWIRWLDGDSGYADGVPFRLADVDAPETKPVRVTDGAKCEHERALGQKAKAFMVEASKDKKMEIFFTGETDQWGRKIVTMKADGNDIGKLGVAAGHLHSYLFDGKRRKEPKPTWCVI